MRSAVRGFGHRHDEWTGERASSPNGDFAYPRKSHVYEGVILWNGMERSIPILAMGSFPLIGTALLKGSHLSIDFCDAGIVTVDAIR